MSRITGYSGGMAVIPHDRIKEAAAKLAAYEDVGLKPSEIRELLDVVGADKDGFYCPECGENLNKIKGENNGQSY